MSDYNKISTDMKLPRYKETTAVTYIRVSSKEQLSNFSIETQIEQCEQYAKREGIKLLGHFIEEGRSAKTTNREELRKLLDFVAKNKNKVDYVILYKLDRWSRSSTDFYATKGLLLKYGTNLLSVTEPIDDSPVGRFLEGTMAGLAQLDNELKGLRVRDNMKTKAMDGWYPSKAKYGYKNNKTTKRVEPDLDYFEPIKQIFLMYLNGKETSKLAGYLNGLGLRIKGERIKVPRRFKPKDINRILHQSKFYAGKFDWADLHDIEGKHEAMISWQDHLLIQQRLNDLSPEITPKLERPEYVLNFSIRHGHGFLTCGVCGQRMKSCKSKGNGGEYHLYYCANKECSSDKKSIQKHLLEREFEDLLGEVTPSPKYLKFFNEVVLETWKKDQEEIERKHEQAERRLKQLEIEKVETIAMRRRKELSLEDYKSEVDRIENEVVATQLISNENKMDIEELKLLLQQAESFISNIKPLYRGFDTEHKRKLALLVFPKGVNYSNGKCRTNGLSTLFELLSKFEDQKLGKAELVTLPGIEPGLTN